MWLQTSSHILQKRWSTSSSFCNKRVALLKIFNATRWMHWSQKSFKSKRPRVKVSKLGDWCRYLKAILSLYSTCTKNVPLNDFCMALIKRNSDRINSGFFTIVKLYVAAQSKRSQLKRLHQFRGGRLGWFRFTYQTRSCLVNLDNKTCSCSRISWLIGLRVKT